MLKMVSWNINRRSEAWRELIASGAHVALLQEATEPPEDVRDHVVVDAAPWRTDGSGLRRPWRTAVVGLSRDVEIEHLPLKSISDAAWGELAVSRVGTLAVARVRANGFEDGVLVASMYGAWEGPAAHAESRWIYADASVHRLVSDLSLLIGHQRGHRVVAAGDLNILRGYGEHGNAYWERRYATVFARMDALGLPFVGPQAPNGLQADPWPSELPAASKNVPTFRTRQDRPETVTRQLDYVFASNDLAGRLDVRAINAAEHWGPSEHCRVSITLSDP